MLETIQVNTPDHCVAVDITELLSRKVQESGIQSGVCIVYVPHTTAGIFVNEGADPAVVGDVMQTLETLVPWRADYSTLRAIRRPISGPYWWGEARISSWKTGDFSWEHGSACSCVNSTDRAQGKSGLRS